MHSIPSGHLPEEQRNTLRVALTYRRARRAGKGQNEAVDAAMPNRGLNPYATGDKHAEHSANAPQGASLLAVSGEVNRMIAAARFVPVLYLSVGFFEGSCFMDRRQKVEKISNWDGRVSKISNLVVRPRYIDPDYSSEPCDGILTHTGKLEILKLIAKSGAGPYFIARWDQRPEHLDIDMHDASKSAIRKFKNNKDGYGGHHTNRATDPHTRVFDVKIELPDRIIFDGEVSFSNTYEVKISMHAEGQLSVDAQVIRAHPKS